MITSTPSRNTDIKPIVANNTKLPLLIALAYIFLIISFQRFAFERLCIQTPTININMTATIPNPASILSRSIPLFPSVSTNVIAKTILNTSPAIAPPITLAVPFLSLTLRVIVVNVITINNTSSPSRKKIIITSTKL